MLKSLIFFIIGVLLIVLKWRKLVYIENIWIIGCFVLWLISTYILVHKKNKEINTPRPVYLTKP